MYNCTWMCIVQPGLFIVHSAMNVHCASMDVPCVWRITTMIVHCFNHDCTLCNHDSTLCNQDCTLYIEQPLLWILQPRMCIMHCATMTMHYALYRCLWTVLPDCTVHCALYSPLCIMQPWQYSVHCTVHQCIMQPLLSIMQPWLCILHPWQWLNFIKLWPTNL